MTVQTAMKKDLKMKSRMKNGGDNAFQKMLLSRSVRASSEIPMKAETDDNLGVHDPTTQCDPMYSGRLPICRYSHLQRYVLYTSHMIIC